jgi:hypothetical protein
MREYYQNGQGAWRDDDDDDDEEEDEEEDAQ